MAQQTGKFGLPPETLDDLCCVVARSRHLLSFHVKHVDMGYVNHVFTLITRTEDSIVTKGEIIVLLGVGLWMAYGVAFAAGYYDGKRAAKPPVETRTLADLRVPFKGTFFDGP
jgi:hypothetical protein